MNRNQGGDHNNQSRNSAGKIAGERPSGQKSKTGKHDNKDEAVLGKINEDSKAAKKRAE